MKKLLNEKWLVGFLGLIAALPALSTDMYMAAMPLIASSGVSLRPVGLSMVMWFISFSICCCCAGRFRTNMAAGGMLTGLSLFTLSSFLCASAGNVVQLILFRMLQGPAPRRRGRWHGDLPGPLRRRASKTCAGVYQYYPVDYADAGPDDWGDAA
jgi:hypothetical protein